MKFAIRTARFTPDNEDKSNERIICPLLNLTALVFSVGKSSLICSPIFNLLIKFMIGDNPAYFVNFVPVKECLTFCVL